jgi:Tfp pilus assembly protein PilO
MEILKRRVLFGGLIGLLIVIIFFVVFLYRPKMVKRQMVDKEVSTLRKQVAENEAMARDIDKLRDQVTALEESQQEFMSKVAPRSDILTVVREMVNLAQPYNLTFTEMQPPGLDTLLRTENPDRPLQPVPFMLIFQGKYLDIARFIESLKDFPYFIRTPEIDLTARDDIRPIIEVRLLINIYASSLVSATIQQGKKI